ncbi:hypothetical protein ES319_D07G158900v1 [Gossypium barbadense]|uniref:Uncharacterized protein n=1 Tax=Gossypium barbadense TaxID=3634 RepID=A0A5J5QS40_GOSBA|nr:hypothetical protein ES319_D07G158900v1 [Gossypium barbadense]KAB2021717.1 hypothetical protein ES319_D07G158900v1 [Gossypium barbadense]KAB2021718.1 hypothetical protein ES319_D07G158900v1 [Gossypium barbadense]
MCRFLAAIFTANKSSFQPLKFFFLAFQRSLPVPPQICLFYRLKWYCHPLRTPLFWDCHFSSVVASTIVLI